MFLLGKLISIINPKRRTKGENSLAKTPSILSEKEKKHQIQKDFTETHNHPRDKRKFQQFCGQRFWGDPPVHAYESVLIRSFNISPAANGIFDILFHVRDHRFPIYVFVLEDPAVPLPPNVIDHGYHGQSKYSIELKIFLLPTQFRQQDPLGVYKYNSSLRKR